jgi:hypothetical protein
MLQVLHRDVSKVDRVLHMGCAWEAGGGASGPRAGDVQAMRGLAWARVMQARSSDVWTARTHAWARETKGKLTAVMGVHPNVRAL